MPIPLLLLCTPNALQSITLLRSQINQSTGGMIVQARYVSAVI